jgi:O-antigen/teichoic acid export membrane protein
MRRLGEPGSLRESLRALVRRGLLHILGANAIAKLFGFVTTLVLVQLLTRAEYGSFAYALSIVEFAMLSAGLGLSIGVMQFASERSRDEERRALFKYGLARGTQYNLLLALLIALVGLLVPMPVSGSGLIVAGLAVVPLLRFVHLNHLSLLRAQLRNRAFSTLQVVHSVAMLAAVAALGAGFALSGVVAAYYVAPAITVAVGMRVFLWRDYSALRATEYPSRDERRMLLRYSAGMFLIHGMSELIYLVDVFFVGLIVGDESVVAAYKVATIVPFRLLFLAQGAMLFAYPYFARNRDDPAWLRRHLRYLLVGLGALNGALGVLGFIFAPQLIALLFGAEYGDAVVPFRVLMGAFVISGGLRIPAGNVIASLRKVRVSFHIAMISGVLNVVLDVVLIREHGSLGAAIATLVTMAVSAVLDLAYLAYYLRRSEAA